MLKTKSGPAVPSIASQTLAHILALALAAVFAGAACVSPAYADDDKKPDSKSAADKDKDKAGKAAAADSQPASSDHELIQMLTEQIQLLQARVKQLEEKDSAPAAAAISSAPAPAASIVSAPPATPAPAIAPTAPPINATVASAATTAPPAALPAAPTPSAPAAAAPDTDVNEVAPRLHLNAYGDVGYQASDLGHSSNTFELGSFDLFLTARLSDKATVLGETIFLATPDNSINVDLERLMFQYKFNDYFQLGIGRYHTDIGYYNATFHHIQWFSTPIGRPLFLNFDDFGGFLPLQEVGLSMNGNIPSGDLGLHWVAEVGNGRSHNPDSETAQNRVDDNQGKSFNINISAHPKFLSGFVPGFSFYHDDLTAPGMPKINQTISDAYIVYTNARLEWLNEALLIRNNPASERIFYVTAFYTQLSYAFGKYRPYFRYAWENSNNADPLYGVDGTDVFVSRQNDASLGVRYDVEPFAAIKLQYDRFSQRDMSGYDTLGIQFSFSF